MLGLVAAESSGCDCGTSRLVKVVVLLLAEPLLRLGHPAPQYWDYRVGQILELGSAAAAKSVAEHEAVAAELAVEGVAAVGHAEASAGQSAAGEAAVEQAVDER